MKIKKVLAVLLAIALLSTAILATACNEKGIEGIALKEGSALGPVVKGQDPDLKDKTLVVTYKNGEVKEVPITMEMISGFDKNTVGNQEVTITYTEDGETATVKVNISVVQAAPSSLELVNSPYVTDYAAGEKFRPDGMTINAVFSDGSKQPVTEFEYPTEALTADNDGIQVSYGTLTVEVPITVTEPAYAATDAASLQRALSEAEEGAFITVSGNIGEASRPDGYNVFTMKKAVTLVGMEGNNVYGSFVVDCDGAVLRGLNINNCGWVTGEATSAHRNAITVTSNRVTLEFNRLIAPAADSLDATEAIANGIVLSAGTDTDTAVKIRMNKISGYGYENANWDSVAINVVSGYSFPYNTTNSHGSEQSVRLTIDYTDIVNTNIFENDQNDLLYADYALGFERMYVLGYASDSAKAVNALTYGAESGMTLLLKAGDYDLGGISVDNVNFRSVGGPVTVTGLTAGANCTFDGVTVNASESAGE